VSDLIYKKMAAITAELSGVPKAGWNPTQKFAFRSVDDTVAAVHAALVKHEVVCLPEVLSVERSAYTTSKGSEMHVASVLVGYTFAASDGSMVTTTMAGESADSGDKATSKALSMAFKYALFQTFTIPTGDPDPDSETAEPAEAMIPQTKAKLQLVAALDGDAEAAKAAWNGHDGPISKTDLEAIIATAKGDSK
jgi:hypothetical protein